MSGRICSFWRRAVCSGGVTQELPQRSRDQSPADPDPSHSTQRHEQQDNASRGHNRELVC